LLLRNINIGNIMLQGLHVKNRFKACTLNEKAANKKAKHSPVAPAEQLSVFSSSYSSLH